MDPLLVWQLVEQAFIAGHQNQDAAARVCELLLADELTLPPKTDPVIAVRALIEAASSVRRRREAMTAEAILDEVANPKGVPSKKRNRA